MAKNLPGLVIKIGANTKDAIDGLNKVNRAIGQSASGADRMRATWSKVGPALGAAAVGVGALATKLGVDAVQASIAEERELARLNTTLENLGFAGATESVNEFIDNLQFAANVADSDLRPAFSMLLRGTRDVEEAQRALAIAVDVSADGTRDLSAVAQALSRGYSGNTVGLSRLNAGLDKATLKTGDMQLITEKLAQTFGGQASAQSRTLGGAISGVQLAWDELQESFGKGLTGTGDGSVQGLEDAEQRLRDLQPSAERAGQSFNNLGMAALDVYDNFVAMGAAISEMDLDLMRRMLFANNEELRHLNKVALSVGAEFSYTQYAAYGVTKQMTYFKTAAEDATVATDNQTASIKRLQAALGGLAKDQSIMEQRFGLQQLLASGPGKSGVKEGAGGKITQFTTGADRKEFAFSVASQSRELANSLLGDRKRGAARNTLRDAREVIRSLGLPAAFEENLLATVRTPSALRPSAAARPGTPESGAQVSMINYNFAGDLIVRDAADAAEQAKRIARLKALGNGRVAEAARYSAMAG